MYKVLAIMVVCVSMLAVVGCKKEAEETCCGTCKDGEEVTAVEAKEAPAPAAPAPVAPAKEAEKAK